MLLPAVIQQKGVHKGIPASPHPRWSPELALPQIKATTKGICLCTDSAQQGCQGSTRKDTHERALLELLQKAASVMG